jgi:hypothetical protein
VHGFYLLEAFLDGRLAFMGLQDLGGAQLAAVANGRVNPVGLRVVVDRRLIDRP